MISVGRLHRDHNHIAAYIWNFIKMNAVNYLPDFLHS